MKMKTGTNEDSVFVTEHITEHFKAKFSHSYAAEDGSGPPRSYWDIYTIRGGHITCMCFHHEKANIDVGHQVQSLLWALGTAFELGERSKAAAIRKAMGILETGIRK